MQVWESNAPLVSFYLPLLHQCHTLLLGANLRPARSCSLPFATLPRLNSKNNSFQGLRILNASHNFKYVSYTDEASFEEFFDLSQDPHELRNIAGTGSGENDSAVLEYMRARLAELRRCGQGNSVVACP